MSNLVTVWDTEGTPFEVSRANATDLTTHLKWTSYDPNAGTTKKDAPAPTPDEAAEAVEETPDEAAEEVAEEAGEALPQEGAAPKRGRRAKV